jgi:polysaccharide biosynthesis protein PslH
MDTKNKRKSLLVVIFEPPFPPTHGARVDQWNRYLLLKEKGWDLTLVSWVRSSVHTDIPGLRKALAAAFSRVYLLKNEKSFINLMFRLVCLPVYSQHISNMYVTPADCRSLVASMGDLNPAAVLMDHIYSSLLARALAKKLAIPLLYRSNNVEHIYVRQMAKAANTLRGWLKFRLAALHLKSYEYALLREAAWTFDCSADDMAFWRKQGVTNNSWAPPLVDESLLTNLKTLRWEERPYDAVFLGSLFNAANVEAIQWFLTKAMPHLVRLKPDIRVLIAGSKPVVSLRGVTAAWPQVQLLADPPDATAVRAQGRVQINPILRGSGINVKLVEMLFSDSPIVTTPVGLRGFDAASRQAFLVAGNAEDFAAKIVTALEAGPVDADLRASFRGRFGCKGAEDFSRELEALIMPH